MTRVVKRGSIGEEVARATREAQSVERQVGSTPSFPTKFNLKRKKYEKGN